MNLIALSNKEADSLFWLLEDHFFKILREDGEINNMEWLADIMSVYTKCREGRKELELLAEPEEESAATAMAEMEKAVDQFTTLIDEITGPDPEPAKEPEPEKLVFMGPLAAYKREVYEKLKDARKLGISIPDLVKSTLGLCSDEDILKMLKTQKVHISKWEALGNALGVERKATA